MFQDNPREYSPDFGPGYFFYRRSKQLKHSRIWKYMTKDKATVIVSGAQLSKEMTNMEFTSIQSNVVPFSSSVVGTHSLRMADDRKEHALLRKLAGAGMTPANVANMIPSIQKAAEIILSNNADSMSSPDFVPAAEWKMHEVCTDFTLDLAMNSIIGLELKGEELPVFRQALTDWLGGIFSADMTKALEARALMVGKIEAHIENLKKSGSKASGKSALAAMVFATDDENLNTRLTNDQIIDNTLLLILAGSDTSAGTLTLTTLLLGLHPSVYAKLVQEQREAVDLYGTLLSKDLLDNRMNYLDAVLKEAMRIRPITGGSMRGTKETIVLGGKQVPAGSFITYDRYLTHLLDPVTFQKDESHMDVNKGFQPERWLDESTKPTDFIPFGVGPRYCLGAELAMAEMKVFVAVLARQLPEVKLVEPKFGQPILWKERCLVPVPKDGVILDSSMATKVEHEGDDEINWSDLQ
jgi:cytochrome P450